MVKLKSIFKVLIPLTSLLVASQSQALLRLEPGSHFNPSHIDTALGRANLNFIYEGCDRNPDPRRVTLTADPSCTDEVSFRMGSNGNREAINTQVGEITVSYQDQTTTCEEKVTRRIHTNHNLRTEYAKFLEMGCTPDHLLIKDTSEEVNQIRKSMREKSLCQIPETVIEKPGFPTEIPHFKMKANDKGFMIGDTKYSYNHDHNVWCAVYVPRPDPNNPTGCRHHQDWPDQIPLLEKDKNSDRHFVRGTVSLLPGGKAQIRSINKSYPNREAVTRAQMNGEWVDNDKDKGRIDFQTWRKSNGLVRSIVRSYETDSPNSRHQRAINFFARNVFGIGITNSWCDTDHCFANVTQERLERHECTAPASVNLHNGGNGNLCHSCIGITPGHCAIERTEVDFIRGKLQQNRQFRIMDTGEYSLAELPTQGQPVNFTRALEAGLMTNYDRIVTNPKNPGCHSGYAPSFDNLFEQSDDGDGVRSVSNEDKTL